MTVLHMPFVLLFFSAPPKEPLKVLGELIDGDFSTPWVVDGAGVLYANFSGRDALLFPMRPSEFLAECGRIGDEKSASLVKNNLGLNENRK